MSRNLLLEGFAVVGVGVSCVTLQDPAPFIHVGQTEISKIPIFGSITKTCNNMCLVRDGVEFQCKLHSTAPWVRKQLKIGLKWNI